MMEAMMGKFAFVTDEMSEEYCLDIVKDISDIYGLTEQQAIDLINQQWGGTTIVGEHDWIYHEAATTWACRIYKRLVEGKEW
jgi:hypothetical protein